MGIHSRLKANLHRHARRDKTVLPVSRPLLRCELDPRQLKTVADRKFEVQAHTEQSSNSHRHTRHDTDRTVLWCLVWRCELSRPERSVSECVGRHRHCRCDRRTHSDAERTCRAVGQTQFTPPDTTQTALSCPVWRAV